LAIIEAHSRLLYGEFTHSQKQEALHQALLNAFLFFEGVCSELVVDNMGTAITEREGSLIRFNEVFLEFLRPFRIVPRACHPYQPQEKGKIEKGGIHYIRYNFWPLRSFTDLLDVNQQFRHWLDNQANIRIHNTTGERPRDRFQPEALQPLPDFLPDCRETLSVKVHSDFAIRFDGNSYSVPPWAVGKTVIVKADGQTVTLYSREKTLATHTRCWEKKQRIELPAHREAAWKRRPQEWLAVEVSRFISFGEEAQAFLEGLNRTGQPIKKNLHKLLNLHDQYGTSNLIQALQRAMAHNAYGASYMENILHRLADHELEARRQTAITSRYRHSPLVDKPTLDQFDFHHHKSRLDQKTQILNLCSLGFIAKHRNVLFIGNPGTVKTFLAKALIYAACNANIKARFTTAMDMINHLTAAEADHSLVRKLQEYQTPEVLAIDELGYLPLGPQGSHLFFQVISQRHEVKSTLLSTNLSFAEWGNIFDSTTAAAAIADRLVSNAEVLILGGSSYRKKIKS
jgi:DNA replication protein DnaC